MTFPNLLSGLFGAVLGVLGVVILQWRETRRQEAAAARVVFMEVAQNSSALNMARSIGVYVPLASSGWIAEQSRLAHALSPGDCVLLRPSTCGSISSAAGDSQALVHRFRGSRRRQRTHSDAVKPPPPS